MVSNLHLTGGYEFESHFMLFLQLLSPRASPTKVTKVVCDLFAYRFVYLSKCKYEVAFKVGC